MMNRDPVEAFASAMRAAGIECEVPIVADGTLHRFHVTGDRRGSENGWYVLHGDGVAAGRFGCWKRGLSETWHNGGGRELSAAERSELSARLDAMQRQRERMEAERHDKAKAEAVKAWAEAKPAPADHAYLARKGIGPHGARMASDGRLVIPLRIGAELHSLQFIDAGGDKRFMPGGRVSGCYFAIGAPAADGPLCVCEGFATGATIHETTGFAVAVAFNAGNLGAVAKVMRERFPDRTMVVCADDDARTEGNPGLTKGRDAARAVGAVLALPAFGGERPEGATDFNDMAAHAGPDAVRVTILAQLGDASEAMPEPLPESDVTDVTSVQANTGAVSSVTADSVADVTDVTGAAPLSIPESERPCWRVFEDWTPLREAGGTKLRPGVWLFGTKAGKGDDATPTLTQQWVCSPLYMEAVTHDSRDDNFGRLLRFQNTNRKWREWAMPMAMLSGHGDELRATLLAMGVSIDPNAHRLLGQYLQSTVPKRRMRCALQTGWNGDAFILPDEAFGPDQANVIFQTPDRIDEEFAKGGTLEGWREHVAAQAVGNPLLLLAIAASFAGPLLAKCNAESGGIHFVGDSSTGKTTAIEAACATWGGPSYKRSWRATANGMEGAAALFNDGLLALDEISECDPGEVGAIVYALGNGRGKQRASRSGNARGVTRWRCFILSSGERSIGTAMAEGGKRIKAGQAVRLLDVPAARRFGAWDMTHGAANASAFSDTLKRAAAKHYGHAGRAFLHKLTRESRDLGKYLETIKALPEFDPAEGEGQSRRGAARFAMVALAGELATEYGLTGWPEGAAIQAAAEAFRAWQSQRGKGNDESRQILDAVARFIERHGDGRFSDANASGGDGQRVQNRAGWWRDDGNARTYLFTSEGLREAVTGFDFKRALDCLQAVGALPASSGERAKPTRIAGRLVKLYTIDPDKLGDEGASGHGA